MSGSSGGANVGSGAAQQMQATGTIQRPTHAKEYHFLDIELKYGILQVSCPRAGLQWHHVSCFSHLPC